MERGGIKEKTFVSFVTPSPILFHVSSFLAIWETVSTLKPQVHFFLSFCCCLFPSSLPFHSLPSPPLPLHSLGRGVGRIEIILIGRKELTCVSHHDCLVETLSCYYFVPVSQHPWWALKQSKVQGWLVPDAPELITGKAWQDGESPGSPHLLPVEAMARAALLGNWH